MCDPGLEEAVKSIIFAAPRTEIKELQAARNLLVEKYGKDFAMEAMDNKDGTQVAERVARRLRVEPPGEELVGGYLREIARTYGVQWPPEDFVETPEFEEGDDNDDDPSTGEKERVKKSEVPLTTEELAKATPPRDLGPKSPVHIAPPSPRTDNVSPRVRLSRPPELKPGSRMADANAKAKKGKEDSGGGGGTGGGGVGNAKEGKEKKDVVGGKKAVVPGKVPDVDELARRFAELKK